MPAYNEGKNISEVIARTKKVIPNILVVDDGSSDDTYKKSISAGVSVIKHTLNMGKGEALRSAFKKIIADMPHVKYAVVIDADMQYSPEESIRFLDVLRNDKADFVMGYRDFSKVPFRHKMGNFMWRNVFNLMFGTKLRDANCGFIALSRRAVSAVVEKIHGGYIIEDSMLAECVRRKFIIEQVPVSVSYARLSGVFRGIRVVAGVLAFILTEGLRYRLRFS